VRHEGYFLAQAPPALICQASRRQCPGAGGRRDGSPTWPQIHEQVRLGQVGELTAQPDRWAGLSDEAAGTDGPTRYLVRRDAADALCPRNVGVWRLAVSPPGRPVSVRMDGRI
jgi:hypothetical protein